MAASENCYRVRQVAGRFLVTTDHGSWLFLDGREAKLLKSGRAGEDPKLLKKLTEKGVLIDDGNREEVAAKLRGKYSFLWQGTSLHIVIPTLRCNQGCVYCHASSRPAGSEGFDMDEETARATVDFIFQSPSKCIMIEFQGGEPLLNFGIVRYIIKYAREVNRTRRKSLLFSIVSNFSLMDREKMKFLVKNRVGICTSLDGGELLHDANRPLAGKGKGSHGKTAGWIRRINREYERRGVTDRRVHALLTVTKRSLPRWKGIIDEYVRLGLDDVFIRFLNNLGDARRTWRDISYSPEEFMEFWKRSLDYILGLNRKGTPIREWFTGTMARKILKGMEPNFLDQRSPCGAVIGQMAYDHNGDIYTCDEGRMVGDGIFRLGNVRGDSYREVTGSNQACCVIASSVNDAQICDSCAYKPFCGLCPVCSLAEQGSIIGNVPASSRCRIFKAQFDYVFGKIAKDREARKVLLAWTRKRKYARKKTYKQRSR